MPRSVVWPVGELEQLALTALGATPWERFCSAAVPCRVIDLEPRVFEAQGHLFLPARSREILQLSPQQLAAVHVPGSTVRVRPYRQQPAGVHDTVSVAVGLIAASFRPGQSPTAVVLVGMGYAAVAIIEMERDSSGWRVRTVEYMES